jgi:hypothetical protein
MISMNKELDCIMPMFDCCSIVEWLAYSVGWTGDELISEAEHFTYRAERPHADYPTRTGL